MSASPVVLGEVGAFEQAREWEAKRQHPHGVNTLPSALFRMRLSTSATESEVLRGKNILRNALVSHLDGEFYSPLGRAGWSASWQ